MPDEDPSTDEADDDLLPVRMLNEYVYCPRLFHLMRVEGRWDDNHFTVEGRAVHRRVDDFDHVLPEAGAPEPTPGPDGEEPPASAGEDLGDEPPTISRSVSLASERLGITAKLDLVSTLDDEAVPVETKRGRVPDRPERSYEPERVQLMAQGLLLRDHGYTCTHGFLYYRGSRKRVEIPFTRELEADTLQWISKARAAQLTQDLPPPLDDSPKCNGCSLSGICLPDETLALAAGAPAPGAAAVRRLYPVRDEAVPLYVQEQGATVGKSGASLVVRNRAGEIARFRLIDVSQLVLCGNVQITTQTVHLLAEAGVPVVFLSRGHWFYGITHGINLRNAYDRAAQFEVAADPARCLHFAKQVVAAKVANQRTLLRRNAQDLPERTVDEFAQVLRDIDVAAAPNQLLGCEGNGAAIYFRNFHRLLRPRDLDAEWDFTTRNRRPPRDPINAMLSFAYALLAKELTVAILAEGLDPWWGLYHRPRHGRPALALDLMEEFRPLLADSAVLSAVNTGMVSARDFRTSKSGCVMLPEARKALLRAYEARMDQLVTHPTFGYRCTWRAIIRVQVRLFARWLRGELASYTGMVTR
ncbi:MAG: CRISPR-associated endonuclease Cas1 [Planctomycetes bacterium]|nr:CRISPR-associated endonuclease Cas1 [Planctomycetota bacterium]MCC7065159.1 CRISPR-associated endonuclease Cas1 [Planctomycetota bacterium]